MTFPETAPFREGIRPRDEPWAKSNFYVDPHRPDLLIRHVEEPASRLADGGEEYMRFACVREQLGVLQDRYGIPNAGFNVVVMHPEDVYVVTRVIPDGRNLEELLKSGDLTQDIADEVDGAYCRLLDYGRDFMQSGGFYATDIYGLSQFVYSPSAPRDRRVILVDTYASHIGPSYIEPFPSGQVTESHCVQLIDDAVGTIANSLASLGAAGYDMLARQKMLVVLDSIPLLSTDIRKAIHIIKEGLLSGDPATIEDLLFEDGDWLTYAQGAVTFDGFQKWHEFRGHPHDATG